MQSGAQIVVQALLQEGVTHVFGYPGGAIMPFYHALIGSGLTHVLVRHEQNAGHAASGWARLTGKPGVCVSTSGPGALNLITALATAYMDSIPLVAITGQVNGSLLGRDVFQEADTTGAAQSFTKNTYLVHSAKDIPQVLREAFHIASTGRPGPVLIDLPVNVQEELVESFTYPGKADIPGYRPNVKGHAVQIKRVREALRTAQKPLLIAGGGIFLASAQAELRAFCEGYRLPVVTTMMGKGLLPHDHPLLLGMPGSYGVAPANRALRECDVLVVIGARLGDRAVSSPHLELDKKTLVHIDIDPAEIGKNVGTTIPLVGDAKVVLGQLLTNIEPAESEAFIARMQQLRDAQDTALVVYDGYVNPRRLMGRLSDLAPTGTIFTADVGQNQIWATNTLRLPEHGRFLTSGGMGTMGYSLGAAIGAQLARPDATVISIVGDGGFMMNGMELATICEQRLPIKILLLNNRQLGMIRELESYGFEEHIAVDLPGNPDFVKLCDSYGITARRLEHDDGLDKALRTMLAHGGPYLLECAIDPFEDSH